MPSPSPSRPSPAGCTGRLVDQIWADDPPANPVKALAVVASRVRAALGPDILERTATGYRLALADEEVDLRLAGQWADRAEAALREGDVARAEQLASDALDLWSAPHDPDQVGAARLHDRRPTRGCGLPRFAPSLRRRARRRPCSPMRPTAAACATTSVPTPVASCGRCTPTCWQAASGSAAVCARTQPAARAGRGPARGGRPAPDLAGDLEDLGRSGVDPQQGGEHPEHGRLAGAVGAQHSEDGAAWDVEVDAVDGPQVAEGLDQSSGPDGRVNGGVRAGKSARPRFHRTLTAVSRGFGVAGGRRG